MESMECVPTRGRAHGRSYDWVGTLVRDGKLDQAILMAVDGAEVEVDRWMRACMADRLAVMAMEHRDTALAVGARFRAFCADPNPYRLAAYCMDGFPGDLELSTRVESAWAWLQGQSDQAWQVELNLMCAMLAGDIAHPLERLEQSDPGHWSSEVTAVVYPLALAMGCPGMDPPSGSLLDAQLRWLAYGSGSEFCSVSWPGYGAAPWSRSPLPQADGVDFMRAFLCRAMGLAAPFPPSQLEVLGAARGTMLRRLGWVLGGQHRREYRHSALLAVACAEAFFLAGQPDDAARIYTGLMQAYPRHYRFKRELRGLVDESSVLDWVV